jgi:preprotein translocase subunit SecD
LDSIGGQLFGELTSDNRPTPTEPDLYNQLAIILDGVIYSAPNIHVTITNRGIITGNFTPPELVRFANRLNSGTLPAKLRKVEEQNVEKK